MLAATKINENTIWGKLISIESNFGTYNLDKQFIIIGGGEQSTIQLLDNRLSSTHCIIQRVDGKIILINLSENGTYVNNRKVGDGVSLEIKNNERICLVRKSQIAQKIAFKLQLTNQKKAEQYKNQQLTKQDEENDLQQTQKKQKQKNTIQKQDIKQRQKTQKKQKNIQKINYLSQQQIKNTITCPFCIQIMYIPTIVSPCKHRFCGACLTQLVRSKNGNCIKCRNKIQTAIQDKQFTKTINNYLSKHPKQNRDPQQLAQMKQKNIFTTTKPINIVQQIKKQLKTKIQNQTSSTRRPINNDIDSDDDDSVDGQWGCQQCKTPRNGFQCTSSQQHIVCYTCGKLMPNRQDTNDKYNQKCILCSKSFCNLYFPPCIQSGIQLKLIANRESQTKIDLELFRNNKIQYQNIVDFLKVKKYTTKQIFKCVLQKMKNAQFRYLIDRSMMWETPEIEKQIFVKKDDAVCDLCWRKLWFQMVFQYWNQLGNDLPEKIRQKPTCCWGINCRTMTHNEAHANECNHMAYQTRFQ